VLKQNLGGLRFKYSREAERAVTLYLMTLNTDFYEQKKETLVS